MTGKGERRTMAMTNAERQKKFRDKQREITDRQKAQEIERKRKEIIRHVETMSEHEVMKLYQTTVEQQKMYDAINSMVTDIDLEACLSELAL